MDPSILINWKSPFSVLGVSEVLFDFGFIFIEIHVSKLCRPCTAASDLGLHCLAWSKKWDDRLTWVKAHAHFIVLTSVYLLKRIGDI